MRLEVQEEEEAEEVARGQTGTPRRNLDSRWIVGRMFEGEDEEGGGHVTCDGFMTRFWRSFDVPTVIDFFFFQSEAQT